MESESLSQTQHRRHRHAPLAYESLRQSLSPQPTVIPIEHSPPLPSESTSDVYEQPRRLVHPPGAYQATKPHSLIEPTVRFDESQLALFGAMNSGMMQSLKDDLTVAAGKVTPGVDDSPYIQYAIQALTRDRNNPTSEDDFSDGDFEDDMAGNEPLPQRTSGSTVELGYAVPVALPQSSYPGCRQPRRQGGGHEARPPLAQQQKRSELFVVRPTPPLSPIIQRPVRASRHNALETHAAPLRSSRDVDSKLWIPVTKAMPENFHLNDKNYPPLTYKPRILRPFSMIILMTLCLLMTTSLIFSAVYSDRHAGLVAYPGTIYSGQYFLFRLMPQFIAAIILVYAQSIIATSLRILPFTAMASEDARERYLALFQRLYLSSFLWPRLVGPWQFKMFSAASWLALFTIPLQSAAFTCIFVSGEWIWAPVNGVVWALVAIYSTLIAATAVLMMFWFGKWTGLLWDIRSVGDIIPLMNRSNTTKSYKGKEMPEAGTNLRSQLRDRWFDRLGYWRTDSTQTGGIWYSIGSSGSHTEQDPQVIHAMMGKREIYEPSLESHELAVPNNLTHARYRYLPWCLRDGPVAAFVATTGGLLLALLIISFLPQTRLETGFVPLLSAKPDQAGFSAANFLYSFVPSLLGMLLFLLFQSLDQALRIVQPWGELSKPDGGVASKSIIADYAACLPFQAAWRAARVGHWRVALVSLMATLFLVLPILAGGLFMALTRPDGQVRMYPNIPVYGVLLALLFLYVGSLSALVPLRRQFLLPRSVTCLANIISLCSAEELTQDAAFRAVRCKRDLQTRLGADGTADPRDESVWFFGVVPGKDERRLSVRRMKRFTEKISGGRLMRTNVGSMV